MVEAEAGVVLGPDQVFRMPPVGAERRRERVPAPPARAATSSSAAAAADGSSGMHHSPTFLVEDESLRVGASVLVRSALALAAP